MTAHPESASSLAPWRMFRPVPQGIGGEDFRSESSTRYAIPHANFVEDFMGGSSAPDGYILKALPDALMHVRADGKISNR